MTLCNRSNRKIVLLVVALASLSLFPGCFEQLAGLMYIVKGHKVKPKYAGLDAKKVAVLCVSDQSAYGPDTLTYTISKGVSLKLAQGLKKSTVISPAETENWIDINGWSNGRVVELGKDLEADMVVVVEIGSYSIHEGATIFKGRSDVTVTVYDVTNNGRVDFSEGPDHYVFPKDGRPVIQTDERQFEAFYLARLTDRIARLFIEHDKLESFAEDAMLN